jgi:hypothetical protein
MNGELFLMHPSLLRGMSVWAIPSLRTELDSDRTSRWTPFTFSKIIAK